MKIALLSDIHSNVYALAAVLENIKKQQVDTIVNLGDILYGPIEPKATYELLMEHDIVTICGNQDRQIYQATSEEISNNPTMAFIIEDLGAQPLAWMKTLPFDKQLTDDVYLCHGTPENDLIYLLEDISKGEAHLRADKEILKLLNQQSSSLICCGHSHTPRLVSLSNGQTVVNPGSVGLPAYQDDEPIIHIIENFHHHASYAIVEKGKYGWNCQHIKVPYNINDAVKAVNKKNRKDWSLFLSSGRTT